MGSFIVAQAGQSARHMTRKKEFTKRWAVAEEAALKAGIRKYGAGAWVRIRNDKEFGHFLERRTRTQLKDKWRNLLKFGHMTEAEGRRPAGAALDGSTTGNTNTYDVQVRGSEKLPIAIL